MTTIKRKTCGIFLALLLALPARAAEISFDHACDPGQTITIAAVGDVLLHGPLQKQAYKTVNGFQSLWQETAPLIRDADLSYANLEGPSAYGTGSGGRNVKDPGLVFDNNVYTSFPEFNYHPLIASELKRAGFSLVSTANNHAMDRRAVGVDRTIDTLHSAGLPFTGTRTRKQAEDDSFRWHVITEKNGWRIAWIACTFDTNGNADSAHQVLHCFHDTAAIENEIRELHADSSIDAVILTPHWGDEEYTHKIESNQRNLAKRFADAGVSAIFGNHPHVTKPWEKIIANDGREVFVIYSIGNFVSAQDTLDKRTSAVVYLGLSKANGHKAWVNGAVYVPLYMQDAPYSVVPVDAHPELGSGSVKLLESLLGRTGRISSRERVVTNPNCR